MQSDIMVSVICDTYNQEKYISKAIESIISQKTSFNFELIIHDDASTDRTVEIINCYAKKYSNIVAVLEKENQYSKNVPITMLSAINIARGKYIALCEGDDFWIDDSKLESQYEWMKTHKECALVVTNAVRVDESGNTIGEYSDYFKDNSKDMLFPDVINNLGVFPYASMFFRREFYITNYGFLMKVRNFDYVLKTLLATTGTVHCIPVKMAAYRVNADGSWSVTVRDNLDLNIKHIETSIHSFKVLMDYVPAKYREDIRNEIRRREFQLLRLKRDKRTYSDPKYSDLYLGLTKKEKLVIKLDASFPWISDTVRLIDNTIKGSKAYIFFTRSIVDIGGAILHKK